MKDLSKSFIYEEDYHFELREGLGRGTLPSCIKFLVPPLLVSSDWRQRNGKKYF